MIFKLQHSDTITNLCASWRRETVALATPFKYDINISKEIWELFKVKYTNEKYLSTKTGWP